LPVPFVDIAAQDDPLAPELHDVFAGLVRESDWILGKELDAFEGEFAEYCGAEHAIGTDSGLSALELALRAMGVGPGDEVITVANTFVATALAITHAGAMPVLVDVDEDSHCLDPSLLEHAVTERTRAIVPVHLYGRAAEIDEIIAFARRHGLVVVEDACQAHGARYRGRRVGSLGDAAAFSFYPAKNLGAYGDGGIVVTNDADLDERIRLLRNYGQRTKNEHEVQGFNRRLDTLQAAILRRKLRKLDEWNESRRRVASEYAQALSDSDVALPANDDDSRESVWHLYVVRSNARDALREHLSAHGIQTGIHYPTPVHLQPAYRALGYGKGSFPVSERLAKEILSLPMHPMMTNGAVSEVADAVLRFSASDGSEPSALPRRGSKESAVVAASADRRALP
jgi:dTDP-4-amino-4,6-dideoxygalactose transaminase